MEKTQTDSGRSQHRSERDLTGRVDDGAPLGLSYLTHEEFAIHQTRYQGRLLGAVAFAAERPYASTPDCPSAWVDMPVMNDESAYEVWTSSQPVVREDVAGLASARNDDILFGCLEVNAGGNLEAESHSAYGRIFDFIDSRNYGHLLRVWNYIPRINADADGFERYARFNVGRHEAFAAHNRMIGRDTPAACALGSRGDQLVIYFLAAKLPGRRVENPRQISAFYYPLQYGPRSPLFSRAMLMKTAGEPMLFISGTASIVGHETRHIDNAPAQVLETIANIQAVIAQAKLAGLDASSARANLLLKIYLRYPRDLSMVRNCLLQAFGSTPKAVYLQADICRSDLLLEIEAVCLNDSIPMH
jgi:chorismate lyase/3-hydroxybenzoate synthase